MINDHSHFLAAPSTDLIAGSRLPLPELCVAKHDLEDRLVQFGSVACRLAQQFPRTPLGQHASLQLIRCSTSTFANYGEVQSAESRRDFIHKLGICLKELRETRTWLKFAGKMELASLESLHPVLRECDELLAILASSVKTARRNSMPTRP